MKPTVYLETTIPSYLAARLSRDLVIAANQQITHDWWQNCRDSFDVYISRLVIQEISFGDPDAVNRRLEIIKNIPELDIYNEAKILANVLIKNIPLPEKAKIDALHIAIATTNSMDYMLTWNCTHIANAIFRHRIEEICRTLKYEPVVICTPQELIEETNYD